MATFFCEDDYRAYLSLLVERRGRHNVALRSYCLMPNHVHLIVVPGSADGLRRGIGEAHRRPRPTAEGENSMASPEFSGFQIVWRPRISGPWWKIIRGATRPGGKDLF